MTRRKCGPHFRSNIAECSFFGPQRDHFMQKRSYGTRLGMKNRRKER